MAGLAPISLQQRCGIDGRPFPGAKAYFYAAETLTPIITYQDYGLGTPHPFPVEANEYGVFPAIFLDEADEFFRFRITTSGGVILSDLVTLPIIGPTGGGGGSETPIDPDSVFKTGFPIWVPVSGSQAGFVRMNGRTIGSAVSGATERANLDCEALFGFCWNNYSNTICPVSGGRGVSASADWAADKTIALLDMRGKGPFGLLNMGNSTSTAYDDITFAVGDKTTPGSSGGSATHILTKEQLPSYNLTLTDVKTATFDRVVSVTTSDRDVGSGPNTNVISAVNRTTSNTQVQITGTLPSGGSGDEHPTVSPFVLGTWYQKL